MLPVTEQAETFDTFHSTVVVPLFGTICGRTWRCPVVPEPALNDGGGGVIHAPAPHWYEQLCTVAPVQLFTTVLPEQILVGVQVNMTVFTSEPVPPGPVHEME